MSRPSRWLPKILSVLFAMTVVGISIVVILQEREDRQQTSPPENPSGGPRIENAAQPDDPPSLGTIEPNRPRGDVPPPTEDDRFISRSAETAIPSGIKTIHTLPRTAQELAAAFENAKADRCELLPAGEPLEISSFTPYLTQRDRGTDRPIPSLRRSAFTVGLTLSSEEQTRLPALSRGKIVDYIEGHYISVQARVQRDPSSRIRYLHHRPLAAVSKYVGARVTQDAEPAIASSVHDFRSLGLLVEPNEESLGTTNLRTLVIIHMHQRLEERPSGAVERRPDYELAFIHARPSDSSGVEPLVLDSFVTSDGRTRLHHLRSRVPSRARACDIRANVRLTDFTHAGMYPTQAMVREVFVADQAAFTLEQLDKYIRDNDWSGDPWDHLPKILNAIIDSQI